MANHGFITTHKHLTTKALGMLLEEVNQERFQGKLRISKPDEDSDCFLIEEEVPFWLSSPRKVEMRHDDGEILWWIDTVVRHALAKKIGGKISDDGREGHWNPNPDKYMNMWKWKSKSWPCGGYPPKRWVEDVEKLVMLEVRDKKFVHLKTMVMSGHADWEEFKKACRKSWARASMKERRRKTWER